MPTTPLKASPMRATTTVAPTEDKAGGRVGPSPKRREMPLIVHLLAAGITGALGHRVYRKLKARFGEEFFKSKNFLFYAFTVFEGGVNVYAAIFFLLCPSFTAGQLAPSYAKTGELSSPVLRMCLRLFGATEILVANMFFFILNEDNAKTLLKSILVGDLVHYIVYSRFSLNHPKHFLAPGVLAHYATMSTVIMTKLLYLY